MNRRKSSSAGVMGLGLACLCLLAAGWALQSSPAGKANALFIEADTPAPTAPGR